MAFQLPPLAAIRAFEAAARNASFTKAAEELGMHRNTLSRTLAELDMNTAQIRNGMRRPPSSERPRVQSIASAR